MAITARRCWSLIKWWFSYGYDIWYARIIRTSTKSTVSSPQISVYFSCTLFNSSAMSLNRVDWMIKKWRSIFFFLFFVCLTISLFQFVSSIYFCHFRKTQSNFMNRSVQTHGLYRDLKIIRNLTIRAATNAATSNWRQVSFYFLSFLNLFL